MRILHANTRKYLIGFIIKCLYIKFFMSFNTRLSALVGAHIKIKKKRDGKWPDFPQEAKIFTDHQK